MNAIQKFFCGEDVRKNLEGCTSDEIVAIATSPARPENSNTSPYAKILGFHLSYEDDPKPQKNIRRGKKKTRY